MANRDGSVGEVPARPPEKGGGEIAALYDRWAPSYDSDANPTRDLAARLHREAAPAYEEAVVLELGCGTGVHTAWLSGRARKVLAADLSPGMLRRARGRCTARNVSFIRLDLSSPIPLRAGSADLVVITLVLEHLASLAKVMRECARVLRPSGRLFLCELHPERQEAGARARFEGGAGEEVRVPGYPRGVEEHLAAAREAGLTLVELGERRAPTDAPSDPPRVLSLCFEKG